MLKMSLYYVLYLYLNLSSCLALFVKRISFGLIKSQTITLSMCELQLNYKLNDFTHMYSFL